MALLGGLVMMESKNQKRFDILLLANDNDYPWRTFMGSWVLLAFY